MKKPVAIILLLVAGAASTALVAFMTIIVFVMLAMFISVGGEWALYTISALFVYAVSYLGRHPRAYFKTKYNIGDAAFIALACVPELIASAVFYFVHTPVISEETGTDILQFWLLFWLIASAAFTLSLVIRVVIDHIKYRIEHKRHVSSAPLDDDEEDE